jgi:hypothetical protein
VGGLINSTDAPFTPVHEEVEGKTPATGHSIGVGERGMSKYIDIVVIKPIYCLFYLQVTEPLVLRGWLQLLLRRVLEQGIVVCLNMYIL